MVDALRSIEDSGVFTNYGPVNRKFERSLTERVFDNLGDCLTVNCATTGLMMAIRDAAGESTQRRYALMPSFTFAAAAHAAIWAGLTPLLCDIDPGTWAPCPRSEERLLDAYAGKIACVIPYAPFGSCIDLDRYAALAREHRVGIVIDAAASLGTLDEHGRGFGAGFPYPVVYSMHATKVFATTEAGVIHCADTERLGRLRAMGNFGFVQPRIATTIGLNSKLTEVAALMALARLDDLERVADYRAGLARLYKSNLPSFTFQETVGQRIAYMFMPVLLPPQWAKKRGALVAALAERGIGAAHYFSPHLAEHPFFATTSEAGDLAVTQDIAARSLSLPMSDTMTEEDVEQVCTTLTDVMELIA
jgi:dTDP-4-amino-4,6-dideoxygalactose transaminase